jgi:hypothetical protein
VSILGLPDEGRNALMTAALGEADAALEAWRRWEASGAGERDDPIAQRWLPLIGWNLRDAPLDAATHARVRDARRAVWASSARTVAVARPALAALAAAGIPMILLKGSALMDSVYEAPGLRAIGDVDILVGPQHVASARRILGGLGWEPFRKISDRDLLFGHGIDLRKPPFGAVDVHAYLIHECCWPSADQRLWARARPSRLSGGGPEMCVLSPADQLLHLCLHGIRWSPVHGGHWVADAARVIAHTGGTIDWDVLVDEAGRRQMSLQLLQALRVVRERARVDIPDSTLTALERKPHSWVERLECRHKGRPVVSPGGLFVIWGGWRRTVRAAKAEGAVSPPWSRYLAAALGVESPAAVARRFAWHAWGRLRAIGSSRPRRGATVRERF